VRFKSALIHNHLPVTAKWEHILNVYQSDRKNIVRLFYKLTGAHLAPVAQDAMKVSVTVQVMSHTGGPSPNCVASQGNEHCSVFIVLYKGHSVGNWKSCIKNRVYDRYHCV
jgi:hypothetical protein